MTKLTDEELQKLLRHHTSEPKVDRGSLVAIMTGQVSHTTLEKCMAIELLARRAAMREMVGAIEAFFAMMDSTDISDSGKERRIFHIGCTMLTMEKPMADVLAHMKAALARAKEIDG